MSATHDQTTQAKFIFSNFYQLYLQSKNELAKGVVLKKGQAADAPTLAQVHVISSHQNDAAKKWIKGDEEFRSAMSGHLKSLKDARKRLTFLMQEVDEILKKE